MHWTLPPGVQDVARHVYGKIQARRAPDEVLSRCASNAELQDRFAGERCFILATGSSINQQDLRPLQDEFCIGMSMFFLHDNIETIDPEFYVFAPNHSPYDFQLPRKYIEGFNDRLSDETKLFIGHNNYEYSFYQYLQRNPESRPANYTYINYNGSQKFTEDTYDDPSIWDISSRPFGVRTTFLVALQVAMYLGFDEIVLLGTDYDYINYADEDRTKYFYDEDHGIDEDKEWTTEDLFRTYYESWREFRLIDDYLTSQGKTIYNASADSELDVFPEVPLESML